MNEGDDFSVGSPNIATTGVCPILENWSVSTSIPPDPYSPPEIFDMYVSGQVYGDQRFPDGKQIITSRIKNVNKNIVQTINGTVYKLGKCSPKYIEWCELKGCHIPTELEPIRTE